MGKITGKGRHTVKAGNHPHINMLSKAAAMKRVQRQEMGIAFEIKRTTLKPYIACYIKTS